MRRTAVIVVTVAATGLLWAMAGPATAGGGCHGGATDGSGTVVTMSDNCFSPTVLHAAPGEEITWTNEDAVEHTVTGVGETWGSYEAYRSGRATSYAFEANGVYLYSCILHPGMIGAVVVGDGGGDAGLDPAAVVSLPTAPEASTPAEVTAPTTVDTGPGVSGVGIALGIVAGIGLAALVALWLTRLRGRDRSITPA